MLIRRKWGEQALAVGVCLQTMFTADGLRSVTWTIGLFALPAHLNAKCKIGIITAMEQGHKLRVLLLYKAMIPSFRLCGHCQLAELAAQDEIEYRHCLVNHVRRRDLDWAEIIVLSGWTAYLKRELLECSGGMGKPSSTCWMMISCMYRRSLPAAHIMQKRIFRRTFAA